MELGLKRTSRVCRRRHGEVGIVEFGLEDVTEHEVSVVLTDKEVTEPRSY